MIFLSYYMILQIAKQISNCKIANLAPCFAPAGKQKSPRIGGECKTFDTFPTSSSIGRTARRPAPDYLSSAGLALR
jgi:hypothetical protein